MITIGITGGIGSGKSLISKILLSLNYPVFNSDDAAKSILVSNPDVVRQLKSEFGEKVYAQDGELNRKFLANIIFSNAAAREKINAIVHPKVRESFEKFCQQNGHSNLVFNEAAILFETGSYKNFDFNILISAPKKMRIERVMKRDSVDQETVESRMSAQWADEKKMELADFVIVNDESQSVIQQLEVILNSINQPQ